MEDTRGHSVDKMSCSKNYISPEIEGKGSRQPKETGYF